MSLQRQAIALGLLMSKSTLLECAEVLESAVIGKPDPERTEVVKAFVVLKPQYQASKGIG